MITGRRLDVIKMADEFLGLGAIAETKTVAKGERKDSVTLCQYTSVVRRIVAFGSVEKTPITCGVLACRLGFSFPTAFSCLNARPSRTNTTVAPSRNTDRHPVLHAVPLLPPTH